jgi:CDP-diglyceride synthetase
MLFCWLFELVSDKSTLWTLIIGLISILIALMIVGLDHRYEYHIQFMILSFIIPIIVISVMVFHFASDAIKRHLRRDRFRYPIKIGCSQA